MKVKSLVKTANNSPNVNFSNEYDKKDVILIDGCFVPLFKAKEDKRKVDSFYMNKKDGRFTLSINTVYIKENTSDVIAKKNIEKKNKKKGSKKHGK